MPRLSQKSLSKLKTCHKDLQIVILEAIKEFDFIVVYGTRTVEEQFELYKQGRKLVDGVWVKVGSTVTNIDGKSKLSMHNHLPSLAVDLVPYPVDWNNLQRFKDMAEVIKATAKRLGIKITWGGDWIKFKDYPHFELK